MIELFGPATITHKTGTATPVDVGKTKGGGSIEILEHDLNPISDTYDEVKVPYGLRGELNLFKLTSTITISSDLILYDFGEVVITLKYGVLTLYNAKLLLPPNISFGTFDQNVFTLRIIGSKDASGNLLKFE